MFFSHPIRYKFNIQEKSSIYHKILWLIKGFFIDIKPYTFTKDDYKFFFIWAVEKRTIAIVESAVYADYFKAFDELLKVVDKKTKNYIFKCADFGELINHLCLKEINMVPNCFVLLLVLNHEQLFKIWKEYVKERNLYNSIIE